MDQEAEALILYGFLYPGFVPTRSGVFLRDTCCIHLLPCFFISTLATLYLCGAAYAGGISGQVRSAVDGAPVPGATVSVNPGTGVVTDSSGTFELTTVPAGARQLRVSHVGFETRVVPVDALADTAVFLRVDLVPVYIPLDEIEVTASPVGAADVHRSPSFVTVIERSSFENKVTSVPQVLADATGMQVKRLGGLGSFSTLSIRGSSAEQVEVYLDGILLNSALGGGVNLENLPLAQVSRIEVYRGAAAAGNGMGGTVHIRTLSEGQAFRLGGGASWGAFDTKLANLMASGHVDELGYVLIADVMSSDSNFGFLDDNGTEYNLKDDVWTARQNGDFISSGLLVKSTYHLSPQIRIYGQQNCFWKHQGIPGISNNQATHARFHTFRSLSEAGLAIAGRDERYDVTQRLFYTHQGESFQDPYGEVGVGNQSNHYRTRTFGWDGRLHVASDAGSGATLGLEVKRETFLPDSRMKKPVRLFESSRRAVSVRAGGDLKLPRSIGIFSASTNLVHQRSRIYEETVHGYSRPASDTTDARVLLSVRGGFRIDLRPNIWVKANAGRSYRAPSFFELFGDRGGVFGNTDLVPERASTWDAGLRAMLGNGTVAEIGYFDHRYKDLILFLQNSQAVSRPVNLGKARVRGLEGTLDLPVTAWLGLSANYTFQRSRDASDVEYQKGKSLPNRPEHEAYSKLALTAGRWGGSYEYTFEGGNYRDRANLRKIPARHIHNASVQRRCYKGITVAMEAKNLFDNRVADHWGYPLPGRSYFLTVKDTY